MGHPLPLDNYFRHFNTVDTIANIEFPNVWV